MNGFAGEALSRFSVFNDMGFSKTSTSQFLPGEVINTLDVFEAICDLQSSSFLHNSQNLTMQKCVTSGLRNVPAFMLSVSVRVLARRTQPKRQRPTFLEAPCPIRRN